MTESPGPEADPTVTPPRRISAPAQNLRGAAEILQLGGDSAGRAPIAVALDGPDRSTVLGWAEATGPHVVVLKVGLETYLRDGAAIVDDVSAAAPGTGLFLDLKLHDIPNTVAGAARSIAPLAPDFLTVHASGGPAMVAAGSV